MDFLKRFNFNSTSDLISGLGSYAWLLNGNTVGSEKWLGTVDNYGFPIRTNNTERARFLNTGQFLINATALTSASERLQIKTSASEYGLAHTDGTRIGVSYIDTTGWWLGTKSNHTLRFFFNDQTSSMDVGTVNSLGVGAARGVMVGSGDQFLVANRFAVHANGVWVHGTTSDNTQYALKVRNSGGADANNILTVLNDSKVGIGLGATAPQSTIHVNGSTRLLATTSAAGTLTLGTSTAYIFTGTTTTWTLPSAASSTSQFYFIKNRGSGAITLNSASGTEIYTSIGVASLTINAGEGYILICDGTYWLVS